MLKRSKVLIAAALLLFISACSGGGGGGGGDGGSSSDQPSASGAAVTAADLIAQFGTPTIFSIECGRHAFNAATQMWEPQSGFVRIDNWIYARSSTSADGYMLVNGEVIAQSTLSNDYTMYPNPRINPRDFGCGELQSTVELATSGQLRLTSTGSSAEALLTYNTHQVVVNYYVVNNGSSGLTIMYNNGKMISMSTQ